MLKYQSDQPIDDQYWRELAVSVDKIKELGEKDLSSRVGKIINRMSVEEVKDLLSQYEITIDEKIEREVILKKFKELSFEYKQEFLFLADFGQRKKQTIGTFYELRIGKQITRYDSHELAQVKHLYQLLPFHLAELHVFHNWTNRARGRIFSMTKSLNEKRLKLILNEKGKMLVNDLYKGSGQKCFYKLTSYTQLGDVIIIKMYKQVNDTPRPDFDSAFRNKEVQPLFFKIDGKKRILEVKNFTIKEQKALIEYLKRSYSEMEIKPLQTEVYSEYDSESVREAFIYGKPVDEKKYIDIEVSKISFRRSTLRDGAKITLELDGQNIWDSVIDAHEKHCVNLHSLKDLNSITISIEGNKRTIQNHIMENGNILFTMDDGRMNNKKKKRFEEAFLAYFGLPLFQEVSNRGYQAGVRDTIDYVMGASTAQKYSKGELTIVESMQSEKFLISVREEFQICKNCGEKQQELDEEDPVCDSCGNVIFVPVVKNILRPQIHIIRSYIKKRLKDIEQQTGMKVVSDSSPKIDGFKQPFIVLHNEETNEQLQILVTQERLKHTTIKRITTMMVPTLIIMIGALENTLHAYQTNCTQAITFGYIYHAKREELSELINNCMKRMKHRLKATISDAATQAFEALQETLLEPDDVSDKYDDKKFEDDVFAILRDMVPNCQKWGKEKSGQVYPEGIFTISAKDKRREQRKVFSYDCKFTRKNKGYDLNKSEQRKAIDYIEKLNDNDYIFNFSDNNSLEGHIFISNRFQTQQKQAMQDHFYEKLQEGSDVKAIFLGIDELLYLHQQYRENWEHIQSCRHLFYSKLITLLTNTDIKKKNIDNMFEIVLDPALMEIRVLDTQKVTKTLGE
ncbi:TFIIB-type zinc ribbon-containing protein [Priestia megaterium]|uniref:TFIIB-type zinc ribbon-containing protein n=1 Tax=Priestia megaterium TaxID=1404 RepID=UPI003174ABA0